MQNGQPQQALVTQRTAIQGLTPTTFGELLEYAKLASMSGFVPKAFQNRPADVVIVVQMGHTLGLAPVQAMQSIACINGKPSIYGDAAVALVRRSPVCESYVEEPNENETVWTCTAKRRGEPNPIVRTFSEEKAKRAKLWGKQGPWTDYPYRMIQMRARGFCLRDAFADVLMGLSIAEEAQDLPPEQPSQVAAQAEGAGTWRRRKQGELADIEADIEATAAKAPTILAETQATAS